MTAPTNEQVADVLRAAADTLRSRGWCQGTGMTDDGRVCAMAALSLADLDLHKEGLGPRYHAARHVLTEVINEDRDRFISIPKWNDLPERTQEEVEKAFLLAADRIEVAE